MNANRARLGLAVGAAAGLAGAPAAARARWSSAPDPTGGRPLDLPEGEPFLVPTPDGAVISALSMGPARRPPIVAAHGWTADRRVWAPTARILVGAGHHVVVYDERGHGASTTGSALLDVTTLSDDLRAVLDAVDAREAVVAGHSLGGMAVQCFADRHKDVLADRVAAIVLVSTASEHVIAGGAYLRLARRVVGSRLVERAVSNHAVGPFLVRGAFGRRPAMSHLLATAETFTATPAAVRQTLLGAMAGLDLTAGLPALTVPTVVVSGTRDTLTLPGRSRTIVSLAPAARLEVVPGGGHQLVFEAPERLAAILAGLVSGAQHPDRKGDPS